MARHSVTEVTHQGFGKRLTNSITGAILGGCLFIAAFPLLWWNEGRAISEYRALSEGADAVVNVANDRIAAANEGKLVHVSGRVEATPLIADAGIGVSVDGLALRRIVEMYQWQESRETHEKKTLGGGSDTVTEYKYQTDWDDDPINSADFHDASNYQNPSDWPLKSDGFAAPEAKLGAFTLTDSVRAEISDWRVLEPKLAASYPQTYGSFRQIASGALYQGDHPEQPKVGDLRIRYEYQPEAIFSVVARQTGQQLDVYTSSNGRSVLLVSSGEVAAAKMFQGAQQRNSVITWLLRLAGSLGMWLGLSMVFAPISRVLDILPMLGTIGSWGIALVTGLVSLLLSVLTIGISWVFYRPLLGGTLIALALALFIWSRRRGAPAATPTASPPPPPPPPAGAGT